MMRRYTSVAAAFGLVAGLTVHQAAAETESAPVVTPYTRAQLVALERGDGARLTIGLRMTLKPGWHTYWRNPGDSGEPPTLRISTPDGATAAVVGWPAPERIDIGGIVSYGHHGDVLFVAKATLPPDAAYVEAEATWLVCEKVCVPESGKFRLDLASTRTPDPASAGTLDRLKPVLPPSVEATVARDGGKLRLTIDVAKLGGKPATAYFFPYQSDIVDHSARQAMRIDGGSMVLEMTPFDVRTKAPLELSGLLEVEGPAADGGPRTRRYEVLARFGG